MKNQLKILNKKIKGIEKEVKEKKKNQPKEMTDEQEEMLDDLGWQELKPFAKEAKDLDKKKHILLKISKWTTQFYNSKEYKRLMKLLKEEEEGEDEEIILYETDEIGHNTKGNYSKEESSYCESTLVLNKNGKLVYKFELSEGGWDYPDEDKLLSEENLRYFKFSYLKSVLKYISSKKVYDSIIERVEEML